MSKPTINPSRLVSLPLMVNDEYCTPGELAQQPVARSTWKSEVASFQGPHAALLDTVEPENLISREAK